MKQILDTPRLILREMSLADLDFVAAMLPVAAGQPVLGTWQQIFHLEGDVRPRQRTVVVTVMGE